MTPSQLDVAIRNSEAYARDVCGYKLGTNMTFIHVSGVDSRPDAPIHLLAPLDVFVTACISVIIHTSVITHT